MNLKSIQKDVKEIVESKDSKRAFVFYRKAILFIRDEVELNQGWDRYLDALRPLVELRNQGGKELNYGYGKGKGKKKKKKNKHKK